MSACALFIIGITRSCRGRSARRMRQRYLPGNRLSPRAEDALAGIDRSSPLDISDDDHRRHRRRKARLMERNQIMAFDAVDAVDRAFRRTAVRMLIRIQDVKTALASPSPRGCPRPAESRSEPRPLRLSISCDGNAGSITMSPTSSSIASKSSDRHVQLTVSTWRFAPTVSDTPRSSNASAISSVVVRSGCPCRGPATQDG